MDVPSSGSTERMALSYSQTLRHIAKLIENGDPDSAIALCEKIYASAQEAGVVQPDIFYLLGIAYHYQLRTSEANDAINRALKIVGKTPAFEAEPPLATLFVYEETREICDFYNQVHSTYAGDIQVFWTRDLNGGGDTIGQDFKNFLYRRYTSQGRTFRHALEAFCGPGFIGFSLLGHRICERLTLTDINPKALSACNRTIRENDLVGRVDTYVSDCLNDVPTTATWDLVVANPPHSSKPLGRPQELTYLDRDFAAHRMFLRQVAPRLDSDGVILLQEACKHSRPDEFSDMIEESGLRLVESLPCPSNHAYYYMVLQRA